MSADFFKKRISVALGLVCFVGFVVGACMYARKRTVEIGVDKSFYFLVHTSSHVQASTHEVQLVGGAGYLLQGENNAVVAFSVYVNERDATRAETRLKQTGTQANTVKMQSGNLKIKRRDRGKVKRLQGAFESLYGNICVLEREIARLENGATQQSSARILDTIARNLEFLAKTYAEDYFEYAKACLDGAKALREEKANIIYVKDLRYVQCVLCVAYRDLVKNERL